MDVLRRHISEIWYAGVQAVNPARTVIRAFSQYPEMLDAARQARRIIVVGGGKSASAMAQGLESAIEDFLDRACGLVTVPSGLSQVSSRIEVKSVRPIGKNEPTQEAVEATKQMCDLLATATDDDIVICLISGGASATMCLPIKSISLDDKIMVTKKLSEAGATIDELNSVRKHLSQIKGGRLIENCRASSVWSLVISDVANNRLDVIGSGPTAADPSTFRDALQIIDHFIPNGDAPVGAGFARCRAPNGRAAAWLRLSSPPRPRDGPRSDRSGEPDIPRVGGPAA